MMALMATMPMMMPTVASAATAATLTEPTLASAWAEGALLALTALRGGALGRRRISPGGAPLTRFGRGGRRLRLRRSLLGLLGPGRRFLRR
jgi:hypothetical protein